MEILFSAYHKIGKHYTVIISASELSGKYEKAKCVMQVGIIGTLFYPTSVTGANALLVRVAKNVLWIPMEFFFLI